MDEQTKQNIGIGVGATLIITVSGIFGYWYYKKLKEKQRMEELMKLTPLESSKEDDYLDDYNQIYDKKDRFFVYNSNKVDKRFKRLETDGDPIAKREKGRLRVAGNRYRKDTPSGYNNNKRNANFSDLIIP